jgi:hypothetical protein
VRAPDASRDLSQVDFVRAALLGDQCDCLLDEAVGRMPGSRLPHGSPNIGDDLW